ncbi:MAG: porin [Betaproteobacteria bacterium]|nr:porin [Betaproteobacteria bacterium]MDE2004534.1 porin [Betaproteobacteria bacterium]MDE2359149.1 porin [Betaproteobacteria bacterium]
MKKKLVAVAVAGVLGVPLAAHAQTANVTLYGRVNLDLEVMSGKQADGSNPNVLRLSSNTSRFGLKGVESLGGGLNAIFQIESGVSADAGGGVLAGRETFAGLQGSWGTVKAGNFLNTTDDLHAIFGSTPTLLTGIFSTANLWAQGPQARTNGGFDTRDGNSLRYDSPSYNGLTYSVQGSTMENAIHAYILGANVIYTNGPIQLGAAYGSNQKVRGIGLNDRDYTLTGGYNFGPVRVAGVYEYTKYETSSGDLTRNFYGISGIIPAGPGQIYAFYGHAGDGKGSASDATARIGALAHGSNTGANVWELTYTYSLSKRTAIYGGYTRIDNKSNANYSFNINPYAVTPGGNPSGLVLGMYHLF